MNILHMHACSTTSLLITNKPGHSLCSSFLLQETEEIMKQARASSARQDREKARQREKLEERKKAKKAKQQQKEDMAKELVQMVTDIEKA